MINNKGLEILKEWNKENSPTPFLDMMLLGYNVFEMEETSRELKRSKFYIINLYRKLFNKERFNIEYKYKYILPKNTIK